MWHRRLSLSRGVAGLIVEDMRVDGASCRLAAALIRFDRPGGSTADAYGVSLIGAAWRDERGGTLWGWPEDDGGIRLRESAEHPAACALLPPAVSLALSLRHAGVEFGAKAVIAGAGIPARIARSVVGERGCRLDLGGIADSAGVGGGAGPDLVIVASDDGSLLQRALSTCRSWGDVFSFGDALLSGPLDYYSEIHRRALAVHTVPLRPRLLPGEADRIARGQSNMARALANMPRPAGATLPALDRNGACLGEVVSDEDGAWGLLVTRES